MSFHCSIVIEEEKEGEGAEILLQILYQTVSADRHVPMTHHNTGFDGTVSLSFHNGSETMVPQIPYLALILLVENLEKDEENLLQSADAWLQEKNSARKAVLRVSMETNKRIRDSTVASMMDIQQGTIRGETFGFEIQTRQ